MNNFNCTSKKVFLLAFLFLLVITNIQSKTTQDSTNLQISISKQSPTVISLSPYVTENLFNLGYERNILAVTSFCNRPEKAKFKQKIGGIIDPNTEAILALSPDIVFATKEDQSLEQVRRMRNIGINVFVLQEVKSFQDICQNFLLVASVIRKEEMAKIELKNIQSKLAKIKSRNISRKSRKIFFVVETEPLITVSRQSFLNDMLSFVNAENVVVETSPRYPFFSKEKLVLMKPDLVIFIAKKDRNKSQFLADLGLKAKAVFVEPDVFSRGNPSAFLEAVERLDKILR